MRDREKCFYAFKSLNKDEVFVAIHIFTFYVGHDWHKERDRHLFISQFMYHIVEFKKNLSICADNKKNTCNVTIPANELCSYISEYNYSYTPFNRHLIGIF